MSQTNFDDLEAVFEQPDGEFKANLPEALDGAAENIEHLLALHPDAFETLSTRMSTLDDIGTDATEEPGTVREFITVLWDGLSLVTEMVPAVSEEVTEEYAVNWKPTHSPVSFHMTADPETGTVAGGLGLLDDPGIGFERTTNVMFSMLNDDSFNATLAYVQNRYEVVGSLERARSFNDMMDTVTENTENLNPE
ncbi:hypothetical protein [Halococcus sp. AFM35]|uniref:hypothetical protein n=1 Tax=Halococcus sp. AFM35 TaxID=3421653 RepID=UPI003EC0EF98